MPSNIFDEWRADRLLRRNAAAFVAELRQEPDESDAAWLAAEITKGDVDRARWELRYARRAIGLLVAQRAALDDRIASVVAHEMAASLADDPNVAADMGKVVERQFNDRLRSYREALARRGVAVPSATRLARGLLSVSGAMGDLGGARLQRAADITGRYDSQASEAVRRIFGMAALAEDLPPSAQVAPRR